MKLFQNRAIGAILFSGFISGLYRFPVWTLMTLYFLKYSNLSYIDIGMIFTVQGLIPVAITPFVGKFSDNNGRKKSLLFGLWLSELSFLIMIMSVIFNINAFFKCDRLNVCFSNDIFLRFTPCMRSSVEWENDCHRYAK